MSSSNNFQFLVLSLLYGLSCVVCEEKFDPTTYDYCAEPCGDKGEFPHSACECTQVPPRLEIDYDPSIEDYRQVILDAHNYRRNFVASGEETRPAEGVTQKAANMMGMNYDLELEYIARCYGLNDWGQSFDLEGPGHDKCRKRHGKLSSGQNLYGSSLIKNDTLELSWYDEVENVPDTHFYDQFPAPTHGPKKVGHFSQMVWWSADLVGCVRVYKPDNANAWRFSLICNYGSTVYKTSGNRLGETIYAKGEPCSQCPNDLKCESEKYPALCGPIRPATKDPPFKGKKGQTGSAEIVKMGWRIFVTVALVAVLIY